MAQDKATTSAICSSAETEDWLAMELEERNGCRGKTVSWCEANARPLISLASLSVAVVVLAAMVFG